MKKIPNSVIVYHSKSGAIELRGDVRAETVWATQAQIAEVFGVERSVITKHVRNIFRDKELKALAVCANFAHTADDGKIYQVQHYNLDVILAIGYRTNSLRAIEFRKWATKTLRQHITKGYTLNPKVIKNNYIEFQKAIENIKQLLPVGSNIDHASVLELVSAFADTWLSLDAYDKDALQQKGATKKRVAMTAEKLAVSIADFKVILVDKGEATDLFATERNTGNIAGIVGNVMQSFGGNDLYSTVEEKAAHLLYFIVKNHPFVDGNKRSGAYAFVWFLRQAKILDMTRMTPPALTSLTLFIAESDPKHKEKMIKLVLQLLKKGK